MDNNLLDTKSINSKLNNEETINFIYCFNNFCFIETENIIILNYNHLKDILSEKIYDLITNKIIFTIDEILKNYNTFNVKVYIKTLTISDIDKHKNFIISLSNILKEKYPNKLNKCVISDQSYLFSNIYSFISMFIDKKTLEKIVIDDI